MSGSESGAGDRTEAATPRRLQRRPGRGPSPVPTELAGLAGLPGASLALLVFAPSAAGDLARHLVVFLSLSATLDVSQGIAGPLRLAGLAALRAAAPAVFGALVAGTATVLLLTGLLLSCAPLRPNFSRLSPGAGLKRLLGSSGLVQGLKSCAKIAAISALAWYSLADDLTKLLAAPFTDASSLAQRCVRGAVHELIAVLLAQAVIAAADLLVDSAAPRPDDAHEPPANP